MSRLEPNQIPVVWEALRPLDAMAISQTLMAINQDPNDFRGSGISHNAMVLAVCETANRRNWILDLMTQARADYNLVELDPLIDSLSSAATGSVLDPHLSLVLGKHVPFLARKTLRTHLQFLNQGNTRVLCIDGDPDTGKTHTRSFVHHLEESRHANSDDPFVSVEVDLATNLRNNNPVAFDALFLAEIIVRQLPTMRFPAAKRQAFIRQSEQPAAWVKEFLRWLSDALTGDAEVYWVLIDGFREGLLDEGAQHLIDGLIAAVLNETDERRPQLTCIRLLLMDFDQSGLEQYDSGWDLDETLDLTTMGSSLVDEIHRYFLEATPDTFNGLGQLGMVNKLADARAEVETAIQASSKPAMEALADALVDEVRKLEGNP